MKTISEKEKQEIYRTYTNGGGVINCINKFHHSGKIIKRVLLEFGIGSPSIEASDYSTRKPNGYWNDKKKCEDVAKLCRNRGEFIHRFVSAYKYTKLNGWMEDFDKYFDKEPLFVDYTKKVHMVYVYEIGQTNSVYVGRTTNLKRRDNSHRKDNDTLHRHCVENNIKIPEPIILIKDINAEESQIQEDRWINEYKSKGWNIINIASTGKGSSSLGATNRKWTYDACAIVASECTTKEEYRRKYPTAHRVSTQNKWINDFFDNVKRNNGCFDTLEKCIDECKKYESIGDVRKHYPFLYRKICQNKWNDDVRLILGWK